MRFEKINNDKIKIIITADDLSERGIKISDLKYGNKETGDLFQEIIQEAIFECEFDIDNKPVLVEAIPISINTIEVFVTRVGEEEAVDELAGKLDLINKIRERSNKSNKQIDDRLDRFKKIKAKNKGTLLFKFKDLDDVCNASKVASGYFDGRDKLYKYEDNYYLVLHTSSNKIYEKSDVVENIFREFAEIVEDINFYFFEEHGTVILEKDVVKNLQLV